MVLGCPIFQTHANKESPRPFNDIQDVRMMRDIEGSKRTVWMIQNRRSPASMEDKHPKLLAVSSISRWRADGCWCWGSSFSRSGTIRIGTLAATSVLRAEMWCWSSLSKISCLSSVLENRPSIVSIDDLHPWSGVIFQKYQELSWQLSPFWVFGCKEALDALSAWSSSAAIYHPSCLWYLVIWKSHLLESL